MNSKLVLAFLCGGVLASGIAYLAVNRTAAPMPPVAAASKPIYVAPAAPDPVPPVQAELPGEPPVQRPVRAALHEKPSPVLAAVPETPAALTQIPVAPLPPPQLAPQPEPVATVPPMPEPLPPPVPQPQTITLAVGTLLPVCMGETVTAGRNQPGDTFLATLDQPLVVNGLVIAERGARLEGRVVESDPGGRVKGLSHLDLELVKLSTSDGQHIRIRTSSFQKQSQPSTGSDAAKVGIGAVLGAAIGGIAGGRKGAGIGAGVGGAAGAGDVLLTRGKAASIPVETRIGFRLQEAVTITERLR